MHEHRTSLRLLFAVPVFALAVAAVPTPVVAAAAVPTPAVAAAAVPTSAVAAPTSAAPRLTLTPDSDHVRVGTAMRVVGSGFPPFDNSDGANPVGCRVTEAGASVGSCSATGKGGIEGSFDAVGDLGRHTITVSYGTVSATVTLVLVTDTTVPDLTGLDGRSAVAAIEQADLVACKPVSANGTVVSQAPPADTVVLTGSCVAPVLEPTAPKDVRVAVPDVVGRTAGAAQSMLGAAGLSSTLTAGGGRVVDQDPNAGTRVAPRSAVRLRTAVLPTLVPVPDVTGVQVGAARDLLGAVGLALAGNPAGDAQVIGQEPVPGTRVPPGTAVAVTLEPPGSDPFGGLAASDDSSGGSGPPGWLLLGGVVVLLAVLTAAVRRLRHRDAAAHSHAVLRLTASPDPSLDVTTRASSRDAGLPLRLVPVPDGSQTPELLEVP